MITFPIWIIPFLLWILVDIMRFDYTVLEKIQGYFKEKFK